jgi:hypothetical protein
MKKRIILGLSLIVLGLVIFFLKPLGSLTGFAIAGNIASVGGVWLYILGFGLMVGGILIFNTATVEERVDAHNILSYEKQKNDYRFRRSQGTSVEDPKAWVTRYHAYPRDEGFNKGYIDLSKAKEGFYFSETPEEAIEQVEGRHMIEPRDISVIVIKIARGVYSGMVNRVFTGKGVAEAITSKKIPKANKLISKGLIRLE